MANQKLEADRRLIKALTDCELLDWSRRPNGDLAYLNEVGQKFILQDAEIQKLTDAALAKKKSEAAPAKKPGLAPEKKSSEHVEAKTDPESSAPEKIPASKDRPLNIPKESGY